ncbi:hypothetical protein PIB30_036166 [Stylosanthes scabra]|uniref:Uncharacterized protein n=1 Tax=Stylosanthes scabra TaxID=79078 RepID=A0ABU6ZCH4_9FABA|nr:hypothetical protein [Stylosanthes scabra]
MNIGTTLHGKAGNFNNGTYVARRVRILRPSELGGNCSGYWARLAQIHVKPPLRRPKANTRPKSIMNPLRTRTKGRQHRLLNPHKIGLISTSILYGFVTQDQDRIYTDLKQNKKGAARMLSGTERPKKKKGRENGEQLPFGWRELVAGGDLAWLFSRIRKHVRNFGY